MFAINLHVWRIVSLGLVLIASAASAATPGHVRDHKDAESTIEFVPIAAPAEATILAALEKTGQQDRSSRGQDVPSAARGYCGVGAE